MDNLNPAHLPIRAQVEQQSVPFQLVELLYGETSQPQSSCLIQVPQKAISPSLVFSCESCNRTFKEASHYKNHRKGAACVKKNLKINEHLKKKYGSGKKGDKKVKNSALLVKPYQCNLCGAKFCDKGNVIIHLEKNHHTQEQLWSEINKSSGFLCGKCELWFPCKDQFQHHSHQHEISVNTNREQVNINAPNPQPYYQSLLSCAPSYQSHVEYAPQYQVPNGMLSSNGTATNQMVSNSHIQETPAYTAPVECHSSNPNDVNEHKKSKGRPKEHILGIKGNYCTYCDLQFFDSINLETHIQRNHPNSHLFREIGIEHEVTIFCTNNSTDEKEFDKNTEGTSYQCSICKLKFVSDKDTLHHLSSVHNAARPNYISVATNPQIKRQKKNKPCKKAEDKHSSVQEYHCEFCMKTFSCRSELMRHKLKDKVILCGVCGFCNCNDTQVALHMFSEHNDLLPNAQSKKSTDRTSSASTTDRLDTLTVPTFETRQDSKSSSVDKIKCSACDHYSCSGATLIKHLLTHGQINIECMKCSHTFNNFMHTCDHINQTHPNQIVKVTVQTNFAKVSPNYIVFLTPSLISNNISKDSTFFSSEHIVNFYLCSLCKLFLKGESHLERHIVAVHDKRYQCVPSSQHNDQTFWLSDLEEPVTFCCDVCDLQDPNCESLITHIQRNHMSGKLIIKGPHSSSDHKLAINLFTPISHGVD